MNILPIHPWSLTIPEAKTLQLALSQRILQEDQGGDVKYVAGVDVGFPEDKNVATAAIVVLNFPELTLVEQNIVHCPTAFPYIPGYLSFREIPPILEAFKDIQTIPDLILCDGQGLAHPRRFGLACHLGIILDLPTIGVAKSLLIGKHESLGLDRGDWTPLIYQNETIGAVLRTRKGVKPLYISIGHKISLPTAIDYVLQCSPKYRLPETTRRADRLSKLSNSDRNR